jgi:hypothetical protein
MNLLIYSHYFATPGVGGETIVQSLAATIAELRTLNGDREFNVTVVTETAADSHDDTKFPFLVVRRPGVIRLWQLVRTSDAVHTAGPVFLPMFLAWLSRERLVIEHRGYQATCRNGLFVRQPLIMSIAILIPSWKLVKKLRGSAWFPIAFAIYLYAFVLLLPMTFTSMVAYEDFVVNAYFWTLLGILFRLPTLPLSSQFANAPAPAAGTRVCAR